MWPNILLWIAVGCFVLEGLAVLFEWSLGKFHAIAWGLAAFAGWFLAGIS